MHQPVVAHHKDDLDTTMPFVDMPFYKWLDAHPNPPSKARHALVEYLLPQFPRAVVELNGWLTGTAIPGDRTECYRYCHNQFWYWRLNGGPNDA